MLCGGLCRVGCVSETERERRSAGSEADRVTLR